MSRFLAKSFSKVPCLRPACLREMILYVLAIVSVILAAPRATAERFYMVSPDEPYKGILAHEAREEVQQDLLYERHDLASWAAELHKKKPQNVKEAIIKLDVMLRTGLDDYALQAASELKALYPELKPTEAEKSNRYLMRILFNSYPPHHCPKTAVALIEITPEQINSVMSDGLPKLVDRLSQDWNKEKMDRWLATMFSRSIKKQKLIPAMCKKDSWFLPLGKKLDPWRLSHKNRPGRLFLRLRINRMDSFDEQNKILESLEQTARKDPSDVIKMLDFILAWQTVYSCNPSPRYYEPAELEKYQGPDLSWIAQVARPQTSLEAYYLGMELYESGQWEPAKVFLRKAKTLWETMDEKEKLADGPKERVIDTEIHNPIEKKKFFRTYPVAIDRMIYLCDHQGDASKWIEQKSLTGKLTKKTEAELLQEEKKSADEPDYWCRRAAFYVSKKIDEKGKQRELSKAETALKKGLALTDPKSGPKQERSDRIARILLLKMYAMVLHRQNRHKELYELLLYEMEHSPEYVFQLELIDSAAFCKLHPFLKPNEPIFWEWLESRPPWREGKEKEYLEWMAKTIRENIPKDWNPVNNEVPETVYQFVERIETMSKKGHVSRMLYCIDVLNGNSAIGVEKNLDRLFPLIRNRLKQKDLNKKDRKKLWKRYFDLHIRNDRLEEADKIIEDPDFTARNRYMLRDMASRAVKKDLKEIAFNNWRRYRNLNLNKNYPLFIGGTLDKSLRQHGLGDKIDAYYNEVKKKLPGFVPLEEK